MAEMRKFDVRRFILPFEGLIAGARWRGRIWGDGEETLAFAYGTSVRAAWLMARKLIRLRFVISNNGACRDAIRRAVCRLISRVVASRSQAKCELIALRFCLLALEQMLTSRER